MVYLLVVVRHDECELKRGESLCFVGEVIVIVDEASCSACGDELSLASFPLSINITDLW